MRYRHNRSLQNANTESSDALADIALNSLGLILIVMLVYILMFRDTTRRMVHAADMQASRLEHLEDVEVQNQQLRDEVATMNPDAFKALEATRVRLESELEVRQRQLNESNESLNSARTKMSRLGDQLSARNSVIASLRRRISAAEDEIRMALKSQNELNNDLSTSQSEVARLAAANNELKEKLGRVSEEDQWSGLWRFRNHVEELVDHNDRIESVDWIIDYFVYLDINDGKVTGALFGAHEVKKEHSTGNSQSYATINGSLTANGKLDIELTFGKGSSDYGSEHLKCELEDGMFVGRLESGEHHFGYRNYVGLSRGTKLTESVFQ